jgi:hypothetical protein
MLSLLRNDDDTCERRWQRRNRLVTSCREAGLRSHKCFHANMRHQRKTRLKTATDVWRKVAHIWFLDTLPYEVGTQQCSAFTEWNGRTLVETAKELHLSSGHEVRRHREAQMFAARGRFAVAILRLAYLVWPSHCFDGGFIHLKSSADSLRNAS